MTDRPILFSAPMVRALLAGTKTQTRRVITLPTKTHSGGPIYERPDMGGWEVTTHGGAGCFMIGKNGERLPVPETPGLWHKTTGTCVGVRYQVGDRLYVREEWCSTPAYDDLKPTAMGGDEPLRYKADDATFNWAEADGALSGRRRAGMHMPRWASRLTLLVTDVRVERLQDISEADAVAEGIEQHGRFFGLADADWDDAELSAVAGYRRLWDSINGLGAWDANPWVVAVSFTVQRGNIDEVQP